MEIRIGIGETSSSFGVIQLLRNEIECASFRALHLGKGVIDEYLFIDSANVVNSTYDNLVDVKAAGGNLYLSYNPSPRTSVSLNSMLHYLDLRAQEGNEVYDTDVRNSGFCGSAFVDFSQKFKYGWRFACRVGTCVPSRMWGWTRTAFILRLECGKELLEG